MTGPTRTWADGPNDGPGIDVPEGPADHFTIVPNTVVRDPGLSIAEKGFLLYVLSHRRDYNLTMAQVEAENDNGDDSIRTVVKSLERKRYLHRYRTRDRLGRLGTYRWRVDLHPGDSGTGPDQQEQCKPAGRNQSEVSTPGSTSVGSSGLRRLSTKKTKEEDQKKRSSRAPSATTDRARARETAATTPPEPPNTPEPPTPVYEGVIVSTAHAGTNLATAARPASTRVLPLAALFGPVRETPAEPSPTNRTTTAVPSEPLSGLTPLPRGPRPPGARPRRAWVDDGTPEPARYRRDPDDAERGQT